MLGLLLLPALAGLMLVEFGDTDDVGEDSSAGGDFDNEALGSEGEDRILGTDGSDLINGGHGNDEIDGFAGADLIFGGAGDDTIEGGSYYSETSNEGATIFGGDGMDSIKAQSYLDFELSGGEGDDTIRGSYGDDTIFGDEGNDLLVGGEDDDWSVRSNDSMYGGEGNDTLIGGIGDDSLYGDEGDDFLIGGEDADFLSGGEGSDTLTASLWLPDVDYRSGGLDIAGRDTMEGGSGEDTFQIDLYDEELSSQYPSRLDDTPALAPLPDGYEPTILDFNSTEDVIVLSYSGEAPIDFENSLEFRDWEDGGGTDILMDGDVVAHVVGVSGSDVQSKVFIEKRTEDFPNSWGSV